jgi:outer membrane lipopolysaccharide assembly protein LptE/RlpB
MKKNLNLILILTFLLTLTACGFKTIKNSKNLDIQNITSSGDKRISHVIKNQLLLNSAKNGSQIITINFSSKKNKSAKTKDVAGVISNFYLTLQVDLEIKDVKGNVLVTEIFVVQTSFEATKRKSEQNTLEKTIEQKLTQELADKINLFLMIYFENK